MNFEIVFIKQKTDALKENTKYCNRDSCFFLINDV